MYFVRSSPAEFPVQIRIEHNFGCQKLHIDGFLPGGESTEEEVRISERVHTESRLAEPLIVEYLNRNGATYTQERLDSDRVRYTVIFPAPTGTRADHE